MISSRQAGARRRARVEGCARFVLLLAAAWIAACRSAGAVELPLWEAGAGVAGLYSPDYRGSDQSRGHLYPWPYVVYRGKQIKVERDQVRKLLFGSDRVELSFSVNGNVPVDSSRNNARRGMPDLDPVFEFGPALKFDLYRAPDRSRELSIRLPARGAIATNLWSRAHFIGWDFQPEVGMDWFDLNIGGSPDWNIGVLASYLANTRHYDHFYYSVAPSFATAERPAYEAPGGTAGSQLALTMSKRFHSFWMGGFLRYDSLRGARFSESPLVRTHQNAVAGLAVAWIFARSAEMTDVPEWDPSH